MAPTTAKHNLKMDKSAESITHNTSVASSSSETGSESASDSDSSSEDTVEEQVVEMATKKVPQPVHSSQVSPKPEEETKFRWNLASYMQHENGPKSDSGVGNAETSFSGLRSVVGEMKSLTEEESDASDSTKNGSDSTKDLDRVVQEATAMAKKIQPLLSSFSDSDASITRKNQKRRKRQIKSVTNIPTDSDSDDDEQQKRQIVKMKPVNNYVSPRSNFPDSASDSDRFGEEKNARLPTPELVAPKLPQPKPKSRGRPRKMKSAAAALSGSEGDAKVRKRGRPPLNKNVAHHMSGSENEIPVKKRGRPPLKQKPMARPPSSSDDESRIFEKPPPRRRTLSNRKEPDSSSDSESSSNRSRKSSHKGDMDRKFGLKSNFDVWSKKNKDDEKVKKKELLRKPKYDEPGSDSDHGSYGTKSSRVQEFSASSSESDKEVSTLYIFVNTMVLLIKWDSKILNNFSSKMVIPFCFILLPMKLFSNFVYLLRFFLHFKFAFL